MPEDISFAGAGNYQRLFGCSDVDFMTYEEPVQELGEAAGRLLLAQLSGAALPQRRLVLDCELLPKPTVAAPAAEPVEV